MMRVGVLGLGYVGTVTAACLAASGHHVTGVDPDPVKVDAIRAGRSPVVEPGCDALIAAALRGGRLEVSRSEEAVGDSDVILVCVGTPSGRGGRVDLSALDAAIRSLGPLWQNREFDPTILIRSTVPPGTLRDHVVPMVAEAGRGVRTTEPHLGSCPEFLRETTAVCDFHSPPLVVVGTTDPCTAQAARTLFSFIEAPFHVVAPETAEALKLCCNAFHALKITFSNEIGELCRATGADGRAVMALFCEDRKLNISPAYLRPGFSYGGSCLTKDLRALSEVARRNDLDLPMLSHIAVSNDRRRDNVLDRVLDLGARRVAMLGLSFKSGTDDLRESPYVQLVESLLGKGVEVRIYDVDVDPSRTCGANGAFMEERLPHLRKLLTDDPAAALVQVDCALVARADPEVISALWANQPRHLIDLCGELPEELEHCAGYEGVAW